MEPFVGQVMLFSGNFAPRGWAFCEGQLLDISQNQTLYSIIGTIYGGDGRTTFALPDLRGRAPISFGTAPGMQTYVQGHNIGQEFVTLNTYEIPAHTHEAHASVVPSQEGATGTLTNVNVTVNADSTGATNDPTGKYWANVPKSGPVDINAYGSSHDITMASDAVEVSADVLIGSIPAPSVTVQNGITGSTGSHENRTPALVMNWCIALEGLYPSRS